MYNFVNAQEMAKNHPDTFEAPTKETLDNLKVGDNVKVCHNNERFWTKIEKIDGDKIIAIVDNDLICEQPFGCDDKIQFMKHHIFSTY